MINGKLEAGVVLKEALISGIKLLKSAGIEAPALEAGVILCHVLGCEKTYLYSHDDYKLNNDEYEYLIKCINDRANGKPLQYITGHQEFMSLDFKVTPDVLIPRHDTEVLVEAVIDYVKEAGLKKVNILDIGTGSGCIAVSLARYIKDSRVFAVDVSKGALKVARLNAKNLGVLERITFVRGNVFDGLNQIKAEDAIESGRVDSPHRKSKIFFDVIVSNPPYIPSHDIHTLDVQVKDYEPLSALNGGEDGLDFYRFIIKEAANKLKPHGLLGFEVGYGQAADVLDLMKSEFERIKIVKDLAQVDRVVMGNLR
ncbi:MAG: peptide chain release factor N(5)-glutamine methyltransferase [Bacillota bacterium]